MPFEIVLVGEIDSATWFGDTPSGVSDWITVSALLKESDWIVKGDWQRLLSDVREFRIYLEVVSNSTSIGEINGLDNIRMNLGTIGDVNCDGEVNLLDVDPFVNSLTSDPFNPKADINQDGEVNLLDVGPFVDLLFGG